MKKRMIVVSALIITALMFAEYRLIMHNIKPYLGNGGTVYLEIFGYTDTYYAESIKD